MAATGAPAAWASECFRLASRESYAGLARGGGTDGPFILPRDYPERQSATATVQIAKAGVRLACALTRAFH
jgi:hypothetical protein